MFKFPSTPRNIPMHEMTAIIGGRKQGMTGKEIKSYIDQGRRMRGTYKGKGISTNTISRLLGATHKKKLREDTEKAWYVYEQKKRQHSELERIAEQIKDPKERKKFLKFARQQTERSKGRQYEMEFGYDAESDEYYAESP